MQVSTHSRPKAAGRPHRNVLTLPHGFNTQPPEGGWIIQPSIKRKPERFQHTAARRRLGLLSNVLFSDGLVSTHSRPKAAGFLLFLAACTSSCFNTQPPEGGWEPRWAGYIAHSVSTHSRPKAAGAIKLKHPDLFLKFQHTAARRRLEPGADGKPGEDGFQHTAARRRLGRLLFFNSLSECFNTQPPEGGWKPGADGKPGEDGFQHTAARRRLVTTKSNV